MSRRRFYVDKETGYYNDGRKNEVFSIDCDGNFVLQAISREEMLELIQVLNFAINDSIEKKEVNNGR